MHFQQSSYGGFLFIVIKRKGIGKSKGDRRDQFLGKGVAEEKRRENRKRERERGEGERECVCQVGERQRKQKKKKK